MDKLTCMQAFKLVADAEGFSSAARRTGLRKALLSKHVAQLEEYLGVRLLQRTTRTVSLTEVGKLYYSRCKPLLEEFDELENLIRDTHTSPSGELKISAPTNFSELHLMPIISEFTKQYPEIRINLQLSDSVVDIVDEGFDLALRIGVLPDSSLIAQRLTTVNTVVCATHEYLRAHGEPAQPEALLTHACIVDMNYREGKSWQFEQAGEIQNIKVIGRHNVNSAVAVRELALDNNGIALCPTFAIKKELAEGQLKIVLQDYLIEPFGLHVVYSHRKHLSTKIQLFISLLKQCFTEKDI